MSTRSSLLALDVALAACTCALAWKLRQGNPQPDTAPPKQISSSTSATTRTPPSDPEHDYYQKIKHNTIITPAAAPSVPLSQLLNKVSSEYDSVCEQTWQTIRNYGYICLSLDDDYKAIVNKMFEDLQTFMALPKEEKSKACTGEYKGYADGSLKGFETFQVRWNDRKDFKWPAHPYTFERSTKEYLMMLHEISKILLYSLSQFLKIGENDLVRVLDQHPLPQNAYSSNVLRFFSCGQNSGLMWNALHVQVKEPHSERFSLPIAIMPREEEPLAPVASSLIPSTPEETFLMVHKHQTPLLVREFVDAEYRKRIMRRVKAFLYDEQGTDDH